MENDDGRREWSGELRADQRRGGGRQTSRWLREERDGGEGISGGARRSQGRSTVEIPNMGPTPADVSTTAHGQSHNNSHALINNNAAIIMLNGQTSNQVETLTNSPIGLPLIQTETDKTIHSSRQPLIGSETEKLQQTLGDQHKTNSVTVTSPFNCHSIPNQNIPSYQFLFPNNQFNSPSLPNNKPIFNSQSKLTIPIKPNNRKQLTLHRTQPARQRPEPILTQNHMNPNPTEPTPLLNRTGPITVIPKPNRDSAVDMEAQSEKKRRREDKNQSEKNDEELTQHFLSAGPGSQDCREQ
jgi:hypothetical protein